MVDLVEKLLKQLNLNAPVSALLDVRLPEKNETVLHYAGRQNDVALLNVLTSRCELEKIISPTDLSHWRFLDFIFAESTQGETALYQCLRRLTPPSVSRADRDLAEFLSANLEDVNVYIHKRVKTTIMHMLIEREQLDMLKHVITRLYFEEHIAYMKQDVFGNTPLTKALESGNLSIIETVYKWVKRRLAAQTDRRQGSDSG